MFFKCLDENNDDYKLCENLRKDALEYCPDNWMSFFTEKRAAKNVKK